MLTNDGYALLIGIDDYSAYDASMNNPRGTSALLGSVNDVRAFYRICRELGMRPERIRVLTSPRLDPAELPGALAENLGDATEQSMLDGVKWLARSIAAEPRPSGLLAYSGHGDWIEGKGLALCPSDTVGPNLSHAIPFAALQAIVLSERAAENLTVLLDTCHSGSTGHPQVRARSLTGRSLPAALRADVPAVGDRVLAAAESDGVAYQARFSGVWQGAFSFALGAALDQWRAVQDGASVRLDVSYGQLVQRARRVLEALSFDQRPDLRGQENVSQLAFLQRGTTPAPTVDTPDASLKIGQLDPGIKNYTLFTVRDSSSVDVGAAIAVGTKEYTYRVNGSSYTFEAGKEYWSIPSGLLGKLKSPSSGDTLTLNSSSGTQDWPLSGSVPGFPVSDGTHTARFKVTVPTGDWSGASPPSDVFCLTDGAASPTWGLAIEFRHLSYDSSNNQWSGYIYWYTIAMSTPTGPLIESGKSVELEFSTSSVPTPAKGYHWYKVEIPVRGTTTFKSS